MSDEVVNREAVVVSRECGETIGRDGGPYIRGCVGMRQACSTKGIF